MCPDRFQFLQTCISVSGCRTPLGSTASGMTAVDAAKAPSELICTKSFHCTISTKTHVANETRKRFVDYIEKNCDYYHVVIEKDKKDVKHLHAIFLYPIHRNRRDLQGDIWKRFVKPYHQDDGSLGKYAVKVQVAPGSEWYDEYLNKQSDVEVLATKWDEDDIIAGEYWPDDATQQFLQETARKGSHDGWIATHLDDFKSKYEKYSFDESYEYCLRWYHDHKRDPDTRILRQRAIYLQRFALGDFKPREADRVAYGNAFEREREHKRAYPELVEAAEKKRRLLADS